MSEILDKILLFLCCAFLYMSAIQGEYAIIPFLFAVFFSCLGTYTDNRRLKLAFFLIYIACCQLISGCFLFLPLIVYDIAFYDYRLLSLLSFIPLITNFHNFSLSVLLLTFVFFILSFALKYKTITTIRLQTEYNELRDTAKEIELLQEQKNQSLLENQDYEINVATLNERNRISKEIHDNIGHMLSRSILQVGALLTIAKDAPIKEALTDLKDSLSDGMTSIRNSIHNLHDESIDLYTSMEALVNEFTFCPVTFEYDIKLSPDIKLRYSFIAITKEALSNIIRHSNATKVTICLREHPALYQLIIMDNGVIPEQEKLKLIKLAENQLIFDGMGIQNIRERVKSFHGNINISFDKGFLIFITIPKDNL